MGNNMELDYEMFCYQCEQTANQKGCTKLGVCGKTPEVANLQDLLIFQIKGISCYAKPLIEKGTPMDKSVVSFIENVLFTTLTNVNFDAEVHVELLRESQRIKEELRAYAGAPSQPTLHATYDLPQTKTEMLRDAPIAGIMYDKSLDPDIRSLRQTVLYGLKGISAYGHQARELGYYSDEADDFYILALEALTDDRLSVEELIRLTMRTGEMAIEVMKKLEEANTAIYQNPAPQKVNVHLKKGPFIIVSGHDLKDLEMLLKQTEGTGIHIYTHGEMLPCHGYPGLKKYRHLVGNYGGAWQNQWREFDAFPGAILMTTNCIQKPRPTYIERIFTTGLVEFPGVVHVKNGDFSTVIEAAKRAPGFPETEPEKNITVGFGHDAVAAAGGAIVDAVKSGKIRHFFLIGGCDGAKPGRNYYTQLAEQIPADCVILTLACGKYRFNKLEFGDIGGIPRLLDVGQCNDAYSAVRIAQLLAGAFQCGINDLPLSIILSWYEQKAVAVLLTLLSLGIRKMKLGPSLPAFVSPGLLRLLVEKFDIAPVSTPEEDLAAALK